MALNYGQLQCLSKAKNDVEKTYPLSVGSTTIGKSLSDSIRIKIAEAASSCTITVEESGKATLNKWSNCFLNGTRVIKIHTLQNGDVVELSGRRFQYVNESISHKKFEVTKNSRQTIAAVRTRSPTKLNTRSATKSKIPVAVKKMPGIRARRSHSLTPVSKNVSVYARGSLTAGPSKRRRSVSQNWETRVSKTSLYLVNYVTSPNAKGSPLSNVKRTPQARGFPTLEPDNIPKSAEMLKSPRVTRSSRTPKAFKAEVSVIEDALRSPNGEIDKKILKTPRTPNSPLNNFGNGSVLSDILAEPVSAVEDLKNASTEELLSGTPDLMRIKKLDLEENRSVHNVTARKSSRTPQIVKSANAEDVLDISQAKDDFEEHMSPLIDISNVSGMEPDLPPRLNAGDEESTPNVLKVSENNWTDISEESSHVTEVADSPESAIVGDGTLNGSGESSLILNSTEKSRTSLIRRSSTKSTGDVSGVKDMIAEPKSPLSNLSNISGVAHLSETPTTGDTIESAKKKTRVSKTPFYLLDYVTSPNIKGSPLSIVKRTSQPRGFPTSEADNIVKDAEVLKSPRATRSSRTPKAFKSEVSVIEDTSRSPNGEIDEKILKTPRTPNSPLNNFGNGSELRDILTEPVSPVEDLKNTSTKELLSGTPNLIETKKIDDLVENRSILNVTIRKSSRTPQIVKSANAEDVLDTSQAMDAFKEHMSPLIDISNVSGMEPDLPPNLNASDEESTPSVLKVLENNLSGRSEESSHVTELADSPGSAIVGDGTLNGSGESSLILNSTEKSRTSRIRRSSTKSIGDVSGVKDMIAEPNSPLSNFSNISGLAHLSETPTTGDTIESAKKRTRVSKTPFYLVNYVTSPNVKGSSLNIVKRTSQPRGFSPLEANNIVKVVEVLKSRVTRSSRTPKAFKAEVSVIEDASRSPNGEIDKKILKTPRTPNSSLNNFGNGSELRDILTEPVSPVEDLKNASTKELLSGTPDLIETKKIDDLVENRSTHNVTLRKSSRTPQIVKSANAEDVLDISQAMDAFKEHMSPLIDISNVSGMEPDLPPNLNASAEESTPSILEVSENNLSDSSQESSAGSTTVDDDSLKVSDKLSLILNSTEKSKTSDSGAKDVISEPKSPLSNVSGVEQLSETPATGDTIESAKKKTRVPKTPLHLIDCVTTPNVKTRDFPTLEADNIVKCTEVLKSPRVTRSSRTPKAFKAEVNIIEDAFKSPNGEMHKKILKTPRTPNSPLNNFGNGSELRDIFTEPVSPVEDLENPSTKEDLLMTPNRDYVKTAVQVHSTPVYASTPNVKESPISIAKRSVQSPRVQSSPKIVSELRNENLLTRRSPRLARNTRTPQVLKSNLSLIEDVSGSLEKPTEEFNDARRASKTPRPTKEKSTKELDDSVIAQTSSMQNTPVKRTTRITKMPAYLSDYISTSKVESPVHIIKENVQTPETGASELDNRGEREVKQFAGKQSVKSNNDSVDNIVSRTSTSKMMLRTIRVLKSPLNDLSNVSGVKYIMKSGKSPLNDLSNVGGIKRLFKTPKAQKSPRNDLSNINGVKRMLRTPKEQKSPRNDLSNINGVKRMLRTPKEQKSPRNDLSNINGVKRMLRTPKEQKSPRNDLSNINGVKRMLRTPKEQKSPLNDLSNVGGVKKLLKTPRFQRSPVNDYNDLSGVERMMKTPKIQKEPKNTLGDVSVVEQLLITPPDPMLKTLPKSPINDLSDIKGGKQLFATPNEAKTPNFVGVKKLLKTPKAAVSPMLEDMRQVLASPTVPLCETSHRTPDNEAPPHQVKSSRKKLLTADELLHYLEDDLAEENTKEPTPVKKESRRGKKGQTAVQPRTRRGKNISPAQSPVEVIAKKTRGRKKMELGETSTDLTEQKLSRQTTRREKKNEVHEKEVEDDEIVPQAQVSTRSRRARQPTRAKVVDSEPTEMEIKNADDGEPGESIEGQNGEEPTARPRRGGRRQLVQKLETESQEPLLKEDRTEEIAPRRTRKNGKTAQADEEPKPKKIASNNTSCDSGQEMVEVDEEHEERKQFEKPRRGRRANAGKVNDVDLEQSNEVQNQEISSGSRKGRRPIKTKGKRKSEQEVLEEPEPKMPRPKKSDSDPIEINVDVQTAGTSLQIQERPKRGRANPEQTMKKEGNENLGEFSNTSSRTRRGQKDVAVDEAEKPKRQTRARALKKNNETDGNFEEPDSQKGGLKRQLVEDIEALNLRKKRVQFEDGKRDSSSRTEKAVEVVSQRMTRSRSRK